MGSLSSFFNKFFDSGSGSAIGIDIGSSSIKVVQLADTDEGVKLETYGAMALGPYAEKNVGQAADLPIDTYVEALTDLMNEAKVTSTSGGIAIPFGSTLMTTLRLPNVPEEELAKLVPIEARKHVPVSMSEVSLDWTIIPGTEESESGENDEAEEKVSILAIAIHNNVIQRYKQIIAKAELDALFFEVEIFSTVRAVMPDEGAPVMIFDVGAASTKLYVIDRGVVRATHTVNEGSQNISTTIANALEVSAENAEILKRGLKPTGETRDQSAEVTRAAGTVLDRMFSEALQFQRNYEERHNRSIERVILVGGGVRLDGFTELAGTRFGVPVVQGNPFNRFTAPSFLRETLSQTGPEFAVAAGVALRQLQQRRS